MGDLGGFLPFLIVIIAGIIKAINGANSQQKKQSNRQNRPANYPRPTATPSGSKEQSKQVYSQSKSTVYVEEDHEHHHPHQPVYKSTPSHMYAEEKQKQQMEEFKSKMYQEQAPRDTLQPDVHLGQTIQDEIKHLPSSQTSTNETKEKFKQDVLTGLNGKGLINGIVLSEVLGPPRARKPYQNVISERKRHSK